MKARKQIIKKKSGGDLCVGKLSQKSKKGKKNKVPFTKNLRVILTRLSEGTIHRMMANNDDRISMDFNFSLKIEKGEWKCTNHPTSVMPLISKENICISIRKPNEVATKRNKSDSNTLNVPTVPNGYHLRTRSKKVAELPLKQQKPIVTTIAEIGTKIQKKQLWDACKKMRNKSAINENSVVFAKQSGYAPWPSTILSINKSGSSAIVKYYGFADYKGTVKINEIVQIDHGSVESIVALVQFTLKTKAIKEFARFERGVREIHGAMEL